MVTDEPSKEFVINRAKAFMYFVNDTIHGSFKWYDLNEGLPMFFNKPNNSSKSSQPASKIFYKTSLAGTSCDSCDFLVKDCYMPELEIGDYLIFRNMGSYTKTCAVNFNGIPLPRTIYASSKLWHIIKEAFVNQIECVDLYENNCCVNIMRI